MRTSALSRFPTEICTHRYFLAIMGACVPLPEQGLPAMRNMISPVIMGTCVWLFVYVCMYSCICVRIRIHVCMHVLCLCMNKVYSAMRNMIRSSKTHDFFFLESILELFAFNTHTNKQTNKQTMSCPHTFSHTTTKDHSCGDSDTSSVLTVSFLVHIADVQEKNTV